MGVPLGLNRMSASHRVAILVLALCFGAVSAVGEKYRMEKIVPKRPSPDELTSAHREVTAAEKNRLALERAYAGDVRVCVTIPILCLVFIDRLLQLANALSLFEEAVRLHEHRAWFAGWCCHPVGSHQSVCVAVIQRSILATLV
jgi:hypothetical protein